MPILNGRPRKLVRDEKFFAKDADCMKQNADLAANALVVGGLTCAQCCRVTAIETR